MTTVLLAASVVLLVLNGIFVATEFALVASRRSVLERLADEGNRRARRALRVADGLDLQLAGSQLGITMASIGLGAAAVPAVADLVEGLVGDLVDLPDGVLGAIGVAVALAVVVLAHLVIGETVPKSVAINAPERTLLALSGPHRLYVAAFRPVIRVLHAVANAGVRLLGVAPREVRVTAHTADELARLLAESRREGILAETAHGLLTGALDLGGKRVESIMVPADEVVAVRRGATVDEAEGIIVASGVSRLPVLDGPGEMIGFVHAKDLLALPAEVRHRALPMRRIRRALAVEPSMRLDTVLLAMRRSRVHVAAVVDQQATPSFVGLVTLEDVLESVVGDIVDETD